MPAWRTWSDPCTGSFIRDIPSTLQKDIEAEETSSASLSPTSSCHHVKTNPEPARRPRTHSVQLLSSSSSHLINNSRSKEECLSEQANSRSGQRARRLPWGFQGTGPGRSLSGLEPRGVTPSAPPVNGALGLPLGC